MKNNKTQKLGIDDDLNDFLNSSANDISKELPPLTKEEYDYYMSLPDNK